VKILLFLLVLGLLVSPLVAALPGPAQKRREQLRQALLAQGVSVRLGVRPGVATNPEAARGRAAATDLRLARCSIPLDAPASTPRCLALRQEHTWDIQGLASADEQRRLQEALQAFPQAVEAVELTPHEIAAYWREQGTAQDAERLHGGLLQLQSLYRRERRRT